MQVTSSCTTPHITNGRRSIGEKRYLIRQNPTDFPSYFLYQILINNPIPPLMPIIPNNTPSILLQSNQNRNFQFSSTYPFRWIPKRKEVNMSYQAFGKVGMQHGTDEIIISSVEQNSEWRQSSLLSFIMLTSHLKRSPYLCPPIVTVQQKRKPRAKLLRSVLRLLRTVWRT